ncbi:MAG: glutamate-1-semialdehyde 2,1-aminomutase [Acidobacteriota bacterium]|nr:glutamate-1-semialdehyde 2,1-aminomutase [Acidobacteriota bacterium]
MSLLERASRSMPGGVSSPVRAFRGVGGEPVFVRSAEGAHLVGEDGRSYIDYIGGYGPMILGHGHPEVVEAIRDAAEGGQSFGVPTLGEVELAEAIIEALPSVELVRLVSSGTEATMSALRLARAATGREKVLKYAGCYHGHADSFLVAAGSGAATIGVPSSPGVPSSVTDNTLVAQYNDLDATAGLFERHSDEIAAVIVEPVAGNMGLVPPRDGFLEGLRQLCTQSGTLLVFDEVMTGFRVAWGGAQVRLWHPQVRTEHQPDLTCLAKVIGGGLPVAAYGGRRDLMEQIAPSGNVYQAGTLSGNPIAVAAGRKTLEILGRDNGIAYDRLEASAASLEAGLAALGEKYELTWKIQRCGSMLSFFFADQPVQQLSDVDGSRRELWKRLFHQLLANGVHLPPSPYETLFVSTAHGPREIEETLAAFDRSLAQSELS